MADAKSYSKWPTLRRRADPIELAKALAAARVKVRGTGQPEPARPSAAEEADRTPNWENKSWLIPYANALQCVALSLNIDPAKVKGQIGLWEEGHGIFDESQEFKDRLEVVLANLSDALRERGRSYGEINLRRFAAWVRRIGWEAPQELVAMADEHGTGEQKTLTITEKNANGEPYPRNKREDLFRSRPPVPAESESTLPSDLVSQHSANIAAQRWHESKQKRGAVLSEAESVARERWKSRDEDHAKMTSWLQSEYSPDNETLPFSDDKLTKHLRERMASVARQIGKRVRGESRA